MCVQKNRLIPLSICVIGRFESTPPLPVLSLQYQNNAGHNRVNKVYLFTLYITIQLFILKQNAQHCNTNSIYLFTFQVCKYSINTNNLDRFIKHLTYSPISRGHIRHHYCMSKKQLPIIFCRILYKMGFLDIQQVFFGFWF